MEQLSLLHWVDLGKVRVTLQKELPKRGSQRDLIGQLPATGLCATVNKILR